MKDYAKIEEWMDPEDRVFRQGFEALIDTVNRLHLLPTPINRFKVFESGQSSIVALVNQPDVSPYIFKTSVEPKDIVCEALALRHWRQAVSTPEIYHLHLPDDQLPIAFFTMEHVAGSADNHLTAPRLKEISPDRRINQGLSHEIGKELALIHQLPLPTDISHFPTKTVKSIIKNIRQITEGSVSVSQALEVVAQLTDSKHTLCHCDFLPYNIFYPDTNRLVIFDPDAAITHPMVDLANTLVSTLAEVPEWGTQEAQEILRGYETVTQIDHKILQAFFVTQCVKKAYRWQHKGRTEKAASTIAMIENPPAFLRKNQ